MTFSRKANRLSKMRYDEVSLVGVGAHQDALLVLSKSDPGSSDVNAGDMCDCKDMKTGANGMCKSCGKKMRATMKKSGAGESALQRYELSKMNPNHSKSTGEFTSGSGGGSPKARA